MYTRRNAGMRIRADMETRDDTSDDNFIEVWIFLIMIVKPCLNYGRKIVAVRSAMQDKRDFNAV